MCIGSWTSPTTISYLFPEKFQCQIFVIATRGKYEGSNEEQTWGMVPSRAAWASVGCPSSVESPARWEPALRFLVRYLAESSFADFQDPTACLLLRLCTRWVLIFTFVCQIFKTKCIALLLLHPAFPLRSLINKPMFISWIVPSNALWKKAGCIWVRKENKKTGKPLNLCPQHLSYCSFSLCYCDHGDATGWPSWPTGESSLVASQSNLSAESTFEVWLSYSGVGWRRMCW